MGNKEKGAADVEFLGDSINDGRGGGGGGGGECVSRRFFSSSSSSHPPSLPPRILSASGGGVSVRGLRPPPSCNTTLKGTSSPFREPEGEGGSKRRAVEEVMVVVVGLPPSVALKSMGFRSPPVKPPLDDSSWTTREGFEGTVKADTPLGT